MERNEKKTLKPLICQHLCLRQIFIYNFYVEWCAHHLQWMFDRGVICALPNTAVH